MEDLQKKGFYLNKIEIFGCKDWFGRYYFLLFTREENKGIGFSRINYAHEFNPLNEESLISVKQDSAESPNPPTIDERKKEADFA